MSAKKTNRKRVKFYSTNDGSSGENLLKAEKIIEHFDENNVLEVNDIIELYNIKLFFDNKMYLEAWPPNHLSKLKKVADKFWSVIVKFFNQISDEQFIELYTTVDYQYQENFWTILTKSETVKKIQNETFDKLISNHQIHITYILKQKELVKRYSKELNHYLKNNIDTAEILLSYYEEHRTSIDYELYFPLTLSVDDKQNILDKYLDTPDANINYVSLIAQAKNIKISRKIRLKAKKLHSKLNDELLLKSKPMEYGTSVVISRDQKEKEVISLNETRSIITFSYSTEYLESTLHPLRILLNFRNLFRYFDDQGIIDAICKNSDLSFWEHIFMRGKHEYPTPISFRQKEHASKLQLVIYHHFLKVRKIRIEEVLSIAVTQILVKHYNIENFSFTAPSENLSYLDRIRALIPEMDLFLRKFDAFSNDGKIDIEELQISSDTLNIGDLKSIIPNKYAYPNGDYMSNLMNTFFSDQEVMLYLIDTPGKHNSFYELLYNTEVSYSSFHNRYKERIDNLVNEEYLTINDKGLLTIKNERAIMILKILFKEGVINYNYYPKEIKEEILLFSQKNMIRFESTLFSTDERRYLNYILNTKEFTNGLDLRNSYVHGTNSSLVSDHENDYFNLLRVLTLVFLKVLDDVRMSKKS